MQRRAQATRLALGLGRGAGEVARAWVSVHPGIVPAVARPTRRKDANQQNCNIRHGFHSWCPVNSLQPIASPSPSPERTTPIPALPCCSSCCYPSLLLHFRESPPSFALFPIASPSASPLRQHHHHHHPPVPPRPRRHPTSSSSSPLLTRTSLLQTLLVPARKRPLSPSSPSSTASLPLPGRIASIISLAKVAID